MTSNSVVSVVLMALALGVVSPADKVEISGLSFKLPLSTLMLAGTAVSATLHVLFVALQRRRTALEAALWERYSVLGIEKPSAESFDPFTSTSPVEAAMPTSRADLGQARLAKAINLLITVMVALAIIVFPIVAQIAAVLGVVTSYDSHLAVLFLGIPLLSLLSVLALLIDSA